MLKFDIYTLAESIMISVRSLQRTGRRRFRPAFRLIYYMQKI